jgi:hypothetical protein
MMVVSFTTAEAPTLPCALAHSPLGTRPPPTSRPFADHTDPATAWACTKLPKSDGNVSRRELFFHDARLIGLAAITRYEYALGGCGNWSAPAIFTTETPRSFAVVADFGHQRAAPQTHEALRALTRQRQIDAVIHAGDFAYDFEGKYSTGPFDGKAGDRASWRTCMHAVFAK